MSGVEVASTELAAGSAAAGGLTLRRIVSHAVSRAEVEAMPLSPAIRLHWAGDGDHDLGPRGGSGFTRKGNLAAAADAVAAFAATWRSPR